MPLAQPNDVVLSLNGLPRRETARTLRNMIIRICVSTLLAAMIATAAEVGPERGQLLIAGGNLRGQRILRAFVQLAGEEQARLVIIPTAATDEGLDDDDVELFRELGVTNIVVLHTRDREKADSEEFAKPLKSATAVWMSGGRQWRLADAYLGTKVLVGIQNVLDRGGIVGGGSAGASIMGSYLVRGDSRSNEPIMGDHEVGFGLLKQVGIDQHLLARNRQFDLVKLIEAKPELLGIGLDENTAILVTGDEFEVMGTSYVAIYDRGWMKENDKPFYLLSPGQRFDLAARSPIRAKRRR
ncbi:MAG: cyanophycinase [Verrucomicrobiales bacterium]|nr:cyanophycinase [Verrucomicrobiales bacterium]|tara:strand:+ start:3449 stop:4342 length:894 start_codon:yes stop_codon:yes gene_type:complete